MAYNEDGFWDQDVPFEAECELCGMRIEMTMTPNGWKPMDEDGILQDCPERRKENLNAMPDLP